ncbi:MAG: nucleic acid binding [Marteilia pararefringens]
MSGARTSLSTATAAAGAKSQPECFTLYCGNLSPKCTEQTLFELFHQVGPVQSVSVPKNNEGNNRGFAFVEFVHSESLQYATNVLNGIYIYGFMLHLRPQNSRRNK